MGRGSFGPLLSRVLMVVGATLVAGLVLRLIAAMLSPVLPPLLVRDFGKGWDLLYRMVEPAMPAVMAVGIVCVLWWVITGRRQ